MAKKKNNQNAGAPENTAPETKKKQAKKPASKGEKKSAPKNDKKAAEKPKSERKLTFESPKAINIPLLARMKRA